MSPLRPAHVSIAAALVVSLCGAAEAQMDRRVRIINETSHDIVELYGSPVGTGNPEKGILGQDILAAGDSVIIDFDDGSGYCRFDFRTVFADGLELVREGINICEIGTYRYTD